MIINGLSIKGVPVNDGLVTSGLKLYLDSRNPRSFGNTTSTTWTDLSGNGNHATFYKNPSQLNNSSGVVADGTAIGGNVLLSTSGDIRFDGSTANVQYQYAAGANLGTGITQWTINTWAKINSWVTSPLMTALFTGIYTGGGAGQQTTVNFCLTNYDGVGGSGSYIRAGFFDGSWHLGGTYSPSLNTWYNFSCTYDGTNLKLYVNGTLQQTLNYASTTMTSTLGYRVGRRWDGYDSFDAYIPVAMFYNRALSAAEVSQNFTYHRGRYGV